MAKVKISATVDPAQLERAKELTGLSSVSQLVDRGLAALIKDNLERAHAEGYVRRPQGAETVTTVDGIVWTEMAWDDE
ncbi:MAG: hypothetical protein M0T80_02465 [Actinomycetota bacterium]|nr:hypothetical protein [Actinomycetota bacterium]